MHMPYYEDDHRKSSGKRLFWMVCGESVIRNMMERNGGVLSVPVRSEEGEIIYCGERYTVTEQTINTKEDTDEYYSE